MQQGPLPNGMYATVDIQASLDYLYGLQRFGIKLGLDNIRTLLSRLGAPQQAMAIVHVAGTNGKGSTAAALAAILQAAGYRTGLYTSPHLQRFNERVRVDGAEIGDAEVVRLTERLRAQCSELPITFFEFTTALALEHFRDCRVEVAVLETGLGGRLDATNAVLPELSLLTPIAFDHQQHLGADLEAIAREKAGIIKPGVPVLSAAQPAEVAAVLVGQAAASGSELLQAGCDWQVTSRTDGFDFIGCGWQLQVDRPQLAGRHQHQNLALALAAAAVLAGSGWPIDAQRSAEAVRQVRWAGRLEWWPEIAGVLLDGAHNPAGVKALSDYLDDRQITGVHWIAGFKQDKAWSEMFNLLRPRLKAVYATVPPVDEAVDPARIVTVAAASGCAASRYATPRQALAAALQNRDPGEVVLVAGSLFLVAAAREALPMLSAETQRRN